MEFFDPKYKPAGNSRTKIKIALFIALYIYIRVIYIQYYYHSRGYVLDNHIYVYIQLFLSMVISLYYGALMFVPFAKIRILQKSWDSQFFRKNFATQSRNNDIFFNLQRKLKNM
ncbi:hypothetical protein BMR1_02g01590 [Babesia microti strain RI]|uniref:Uncharacterized protein n=1 Tax=Babesia microti (strain RI) TaxID=1133968 RepID=A0A1R4AAB5_BABMR|nr:hypothetical protein BMR1_02g01590 [Babesia microti strain RI]SJK85917.1 hypothetical protein BMR1_02g01590 [Babesia microti strain RI]|eukprot:XP_021338126.1 hypothetical protein BMR1_02g01590 [Babesia microti strain RI]